MSESVVVPKVSLIVPVYNAERHIERCVNSILAQEFQDLELILVDDGSVDGSPAICDAYARQDARVHVGRQRHPRALVHRRRRHDPRHPGGHSRTGPDHRIARPAPLTDSTAKTRARQERAR